MLETAIPWLIDGQQRNDRLRENGRISFDRSQSFPCNTEERSRPTVRSFPYERGGSEANRDGDERRDRERERERMRERRRGFERGRGRSRSGERGREGGREGEREEERRIESLHSLACLPRLTPPRSLP